jgi:predicted metal-dependent phosphotriesterase family hydrolase
MRVETVRGAMAVDGLGITGMHEHVLVHPGCAVTTSESWGAPR